MAVKIDEIGKHNKQLVLDLKDGKDKSNGYPITDWCHEKSYNYDLSFGVMACGNSSKQLKGTFVGVKYYCADAEMNWDMAKRIVHVYDTKNKAGTQKFYRLIHTKGKPGAYLNTYSACDEITGV
jgi:hypothetical protein